MNFLYSIFGWPLGWIMWALYRIVNNYGVAIVLFTVILQAAMLPLTIRQKKSTARSTAIGPWQQDLQKKYGNNRNKLAEEQQKLYQEAGVSMFGGCSVLLIQMPIIFGLMDVIYRPLSHIMRLGSDVIDKAVEIANGLGIEIIANSLQREITLLGAIQSNPDAFSALGMDNVNSVLNFDATFFTLDFTVTPTLSWNLYIIIPILSALTALIMSLYMEHIRVKSMPENSPQVGGSMKMMMLMSPAISLFIGFGFPIGITLYWTIRNVISILQEFLIDRFMPQKKLVEDAQADIKAKLEEKRKAARGKGKSTAVKKKTEDGKEVVESISDKEYRRRKLAEARKRDAEKYGEEYVEVTDKDLM